MSDDSDINDVRVGHGPASMTMNYVLIKLLINGTVLCSRTYSKLCSIYLGVQGFDIVITRKSLHPDVNHKKDANVKSLERFLVEEHANTQKMISS